MKKKFLSLVAVLVMFLLCFQSMVFAAGPKNENYSLTYSAVQETGHFITVGAQQKTTAATQLLLDSAQAPRIAYCVDADTQLKAGHSYTTANLEDAEYFTAAKAKKLRGILLNSYPFISLEEAKQRSGLHFYADEAITAAQLAIWSVSNDKNYAPAIWPDYGETKRITDLQGWLALCDNTEPASPVANIEIKSAKVGETLDIAYRATQTNSDGSDIALTCSFSPSLSTEPGAKDSEGFSHIVVKQPAASNTITITGTQVVARDAYLYLPKDGRNAAQTLAGVQDKTVPIQASATIPFQTAPPPGTGGGIRIHKIDSATGSPMNDVLFEISSSPDFPTPTYVAITDKDGYAVQSDLTAGDWYVREKETPTGYMPYTGVVTVSVGTGLTDIEIKNTPYSGIKILKVDDQNKPLPGAKFDIYRGSTATGDPIFKDLISDESGVILKDQLTAGTYTVVETAAPEGYELDPTPVTFELKLGETKIVTFTNTHISISGTMHILKYDAVSKKQLAGAEFTIYRDEALTDVVQVITSFADKPAVLENLNAGIYYVKETKVPDGYLIDPTVKPVTIEANQTTVVEFFNTRGVPTAGNYAALQIAGISAIAFCGIGWLCLLIYKKRNKKK